MGVRHEYFRQRSKTIVVQRVVELGWPEDFYGAFDLYGGYEGFREIIKTIPHLSDIDINFLCHYFNLQKEELLCYTRKLSRQALLATNNLANSTKNQ